MLKEVHECTRPARFAAAANEGLATEIAEEEAELAAEEAGW